MAAKECILLVEDDPALAMMIAGILKDADYAVDGPHATLSDGVAAVAAHMPAGAILDVRRGGSDVGMLADDLDLYDIPYIFCSEMADHPVVQAHPSAPLISRTALPLRLVSTLRRIVH
jgi:CheY-like chemotaxis protein